MIFRRGVSIGFLFVVMLAAWWHAFAADHPKFHKGQVVAVTLPTAEVEYFRIGYIDAELVDGEIKHYYTDAQRKIGGEWPEESLRALTPKECH